MTRATYEHCDQPLPVAAGKSAFRIRGEFYRHLDTTIAHVDGKSGGALKRAIARDGLEKFQRQPFVSTAYYDNLPLPRVVMCIAEVTGKDVVALTEKMGRTSAEVQLKGKYRDVIAGLTVDGFADAFSKVLAFYYDYGTLQVERDAASFSVERGGLPLCVAEWWTLVSAPFVQHALEQNGARDVVIASRIAVVGASAPVPLGAVHWTIRFDDQKR